MINGLVKVIYCKIEHYTYYIPKAADWIVQVLSIKYLKKYVCVFLWQNFLCAPFWKGHFHQL